MGQCRRTGQRSEKAHRLGPDADFPMSATFKSRHECAACGSQDLKTIIDFGPMPLAGCFPKESELGTVESLPLALLYCPACKLVQSNGTVDADFLFRDYRYLSSIGLSEYFADVATHLKEKYALSPQHRLIEIGSNDGVFLVPMTVLGCDIIGFEPSTNVSAIARERGCKVINDYFCIESARQNFSEGSIDLVFAANCFAHIDQINDIVQAMRYVLKPGGHAVIEVHYVRNLVDELQYDFVYHEHAYYYSLTSLANLFSSNGMTLTEYEEIPVHSGSIRVTVCNQSSKLPDSIQARLDEEQDSVADWACYADFAKKVHRHKDELNSLLKGLKSDGHRIAGYGASGRANVLCNYCDIGLEIVDYIVDESPERFDRYIPILEVPIRTKEYFDQDENITFVLIFAWNFSKMIMDKLEDRNLKYIIPFPKPRIVERIVDIDDPNSL